MNWDDPVERAALLAQIGVEQYNARVKAYNAASIVSTVNGHGIRPVNTRYGRLFMVEGTTSAFATLEEAETFAAKHSTGEDQ